MRCACDVQVVTVQDNKHEHDYYYVLHYILDMDWCHLVPMEAKSHFGGESFRAGRPRFPALVSRHPRVLQAQPSQALNARQSKVSAGAAAPQRTAIDCNVPRVADSQQHVFISIWILNLNARR